MAPDGSIVETKRVATPDNYVGILQAILTIVRELDGVKRSVCPVGLGTPGAWVESRGEMKNCNSTVLNGRPFVHDLRKLLNRPIRIANDANCMALSEAVDGACAGATIVFGVILGTGVGGGLVVRKQLVEGPNLLAGEWGHNPFPTPPANAHLKLNPMKQLRACHCGQTNCVETFLSGRGLETTHAALHGQRLSSPDIGQGKTADTRETLDEFVEHLAIALSVVVNIIDPDAIVIGGGLSNIGCIYERLPPLLVKYTFSSDGYVNVCRAKYGDSSGKRGAAWLFPVEN